MTIEDKWAKLGRQLGWDWGMADDEKRKRAAKEQAAARDLALEGFYLGAYRWHGLQGFCRVCGILLGGEHASDCPIGKGEARIQALGATVISGCTFEDMGTSIKTGARTLEELTHDGD